MWQTLNLNPGLLTRELPSGPLHLAASLQKEKRVEKLRNLPKIPELRNGRTMAQTQGCLVSHSVKVCASLCTLALQYGSRLIQSEPYVAFPGFSTHCPTCGVWKHFVQCDGPCRRERWHLESLYGCGRGRRCLTRLVLKSLLTPEAAKALAKQWHSPFSGQRLPPSRSFSVQDFWSSAAPAWAVPGEAMSSAIDRHIDFQNHSVGASGHSLTHISFFSL